MNKILAFVSALALGTNSFALTLVIDAEALKDQNDTRISEGSGLVLVLADTLGDGFATNLTAGLSLSTGGMLIGNDMIVAKSVVFSDGFGAGCFEVTFTGLSLAGNWDANDSLALYWFPALSTSTSATANGNYYGVFVGGPGWTTPSGGTASMNFFTSDATELNGGGSYPASRGISSLQIIPEPSSVALVVIGFGLIAAARRRR